MDKDSRSFHDPLPAASRRKSMRPVNELVWQNGHVVMHSQARDTTDSLSEQKENSDNLNQEDESASWMQYPLDDSLTKDLCSDFFCGMPTSESIGIDEMRKDSLAGEKYAKSGFNEEANTFRNPLARQFNRTHNEETIGGTIPQTDHAETSDFVNYSHFSRLAKIDMGMCKQPDQNNTRNVFQKEVGGTSSLVSKLLGNWGINQTQKLTDICHNLSNGSLAELPKQDGEVQNMFYKSGQAETLDPTTVISSSVGFRSSVGRAGQQSTGNQSQKRKGTDMEESASHSEEAENQSVEVERNPQRSTSIRRSRAAEVHNLSERRRRDRINEKMKALQELIPHCNKTDKASMLDEAIEYLKSLQLQVQIMWMGSGISPMTFPNPQQYMSLMGRAMGRGSIDSIPGSCQMPCIPIPNQSTPPVATTNEAATIPVQVLNSVNFSNQLQNPSIPDAHARYLGFNNMNPSSQAMDLFSSIQSLSVQQNETTMSSSDSPHGMNP